MKIADCRLGEKDSNPWKTENFSENVDERFQPRSLGELGLEPFMRRRIFTTRYARGTSEEVRGGALPIEDFRLPIFGKVDFRGLEEF